MIDFEQPKSNIKPVGQSTHPYSRGAMPTIDTPKLAAIQMVLGDQSRLSHREHSRTVFKEVCIPLHEVDDLQTYFQGLFDADYGQSQILISQHL